MGYKIKKIIKCNMNDSTSIAIPRIVDKKSTTPNTAKTIAGINIEVLTLRKVPVKINTALIEKHARDKEPSRMVEVKKALKNLLIFFPVFSTVFGDVFNACVELLTR